MQSPNLGDVSSRRTSARVGRSFPESIPQIVWTASGDGTIDYTNSRWFAFSGTPLGTRPDAGWLQAIHPDDRGASLKEWRRAVENGTDYEVEFRLRRADGAFHWMLSRAIAKRDRRGRIVKWFGTTTDIDAQRNRELTLAYIDEAGAALGESRDVAGAIRETARFIVRRLADWCALYVVTRGGDLDARAVEHADPAKAELAKEFVRDYGLSLNEVLLPAFSAGKALMVPAISVDTLRFTQLDDPQRFGTLVRDLDIDATMCVPVILEKKLWGVIQLGARSGSRMPGGGDLNVGERIAKRLEVAIENALLFEQHRREAQSLRFIASAGERLSISLNLQTTLEALLSLVVPALADVAIVSLVDQRSEQLVVRAIDAADPAKAVLLQPLLGDAPVREGRIGRRVMRLLAGPPQIVAPLTNAALSVLVVPRFHPLAAVLSPASAIVAPLSSGGVFLGSVLLTRSQPDLVYTAQELPIVEELARRASIAIDNAGQYEREQVVAASFQEASLPLRLPTVAGLQFDAWYQPATRAARVGGDWYDAVRLPDGRIVVSVGDVAGSGVGAAVTMATVRHIIRGVAYVNADPTLMLDAADRTMRAEHPNVFATAAVAVYDPVTMFLECASAGHLAPLQLNPADEVVALAACGLPLGLRGRDEPPATVTQIVPDSLLIFYTDGLIESTRNPLDGERRLHNALRREKLRGAAVAKTIFDAVMAGPARDDVALLTIATQATSRSAPGLSRWTFDVRDAARSHAVRSDVVRLLQAKLSASARDDAEAVLGELLGNALRYAPGEIDVALDLCGPAPVVHVLDRGPGFRHNGALPVDMLSETGRGLFLAATLSDGLHITKRPGGGSHARAILALGTAYPSLTATAFDLVLGS